MPREAKNAMALTRCVVTDSHDEPRDAPAERKRLTLLPRSTSNEGNQPSSPRAPKANPFGDAKPRDENAFWERKKADELAAKQAAKAKAEAPVKKVERSTSAGSRERKSSHDDAGEERHGGRGAGRGGRGGRGERQERPAAAGGRGAGRHAAAAAASTPAKKEEPKSKRTEAPKSTKIAPPASTKTKNLFDLLDDSDSD
ncbi:hypothetical protein PINS_up014234 [Pythium insidiosum]|nr:hypothetical protein PINS_up014234 [Pythium insidiosum]